MQNLFAESYQIYGTLESVVLRVPTKGVPASAKISQAKGLVIFPG